MFEDVSNCKKENIAHFTFLNNNFQNNIDLADLKFLLTMGLFFNDIMQFRGNLDPLPPLSLKMTFWLISPPP